MSEQNLLTFFRVFFFFFLTLVVCTEYFIQSTRYSVTYFVYAKEPQGRTYLLSFFLFFFFFFFLNQNFQFTKWGKEVRP